MTVPAIASTTSMNSLRLLQDAHALSRFCTTSWLYSLNGVTQEPTKGLNDLAIFIFSYLSGYVFYV